MKIDLSRFKNYGLWVSLFALVPMILSAFGVKIVPDEYQIAVNSVLAVMVALGVINNPTTDTKWYSDDKAIAPPVEEQKVIESNTEDITK